jgi:hypothetical protein
MFSKGLMKLILHLRNLCLLSTSLSSWLQFLEECENYKIEEGAKPIVDMKKYEFDEVKKCFVPRGSTKGETIEPINTSESTETVASSDSNESRKYLETIEEVDEPESDSNPKSIHEESSDDESGDSTEDKEGEPDSSSDEETFTNKLLLLVCFCNSAKFLTLLARVNIFVRCLIIASLCIPSDLMLLDLSSSYLISA